MDVHHKSPEHKVRGCLIFCCTFCITFQINYRRTSPLRAPLCITPLHFSANLPYPSHTLLPDPKTPTPSLLSLQIECHQYGYLDSLFILPTTVSISVMIWDINPSFNSQPGGPGVTVWSFTQNLPSTFKPTRDQGPNWYSIQISQPHKGVTPRENFSDKLNFKWILNK